MGDVELFEEVVWEADDAGVEINDVSIYEQFGNIFSKLDDVAVVVD